MQRIAHVNGRFVPIEEAQVSILDRGFLFADGVYEVTAVIDGRLIDFEPHAARLYRSLAEIAIQPPVDAAGLRALHEEMVDRNDLAEGLIYLQITRGQAERDFAHPKDATPSIVMFTQAKSVVHNAAADSGIRVVCVPDLRWKRRDIKSVALLAQVMAKQAAVEAGAGEAWMIEDGFVTEGSSSTAFIITSDGRIVTRPLSNAVLPGITRIAVMRLAQEAQLIVEERPFTIGEALAATEAFITSASSFVMPVVEIDGVAIGPGRPGPLSKRLRELYLHAAREPGCAS